MKKQLAMILATALILSMLTACGKNKSSEISDSLSSGSPSLQTEQTEELSTNEPAPEQTQDTETQSSENTENKDQSQTTSDTPSQAQVQANKPASSQTTAHKPTQKPAQSTTSKPASKPSSGSSSSSGSASGITSDNSSSADTLSQKALTEIIQDIYKIHEVPFRLQTIPVDISNTDALKAFTGLSDASKIQEAYASEPMMGSQAYSLVMVRAKHASDASSIAKEMQNGIDPRKWICVEANDLQVAVKGSTIMLYMVDSGLSDCPTSAQMVSAFQTICGSQLDAIYK